MECPAPDHRSLFGDFQADNAPSFQQSVKHDAGDESSDDTHSQSHHSDPRGTEIFDDPLLSNSPDTSPQRSEDEISVLLSDYRSPSRLPSQQSHAEMPYTPMRPRFAFRNSSYVRALQNNDTSPPQYNVNSPSMSQQRLNRFPTPSRNSTPRSVRSLRSARNSISPSKKLKKEYPLVLLHVTLLPIPTPYSAAVMARVLPPYVISNWKTLSEKATSTVLERGILIPHPREDYETLEERLLESLELVLPRVLQCGHFHLSEEESQAILQDREDLDIEDQSAAQSLEICPDCDRPIRDGRYGTGEGNRRWDVKVYAANGLMRSGAWTAAWREMERVDVEIMPWLSEDMRRDLEAAKEEEMAMIIEEQQRHEQHELEPRTNSPMDQERIREVYGAGEPQDLVDGLQDEKLRDVPPSMSRTLSHQRQEVPLSTLLSKYIQNQAQEPRNIAIGVLSLVIVFMAMMILRSTSQQAPSIARFTSTPLIQHTIAPSASLVSSSRPLSSPSPMTESFEKATPKIIVHSEIEEAAPSDITTSREYQRNPSDIENPEDSGTELGKEEEEKTIRADEPSMDHESITIPSGGEGTVVSGET